MLSGGTLARMKRSPVLLGIRRVKREKKKKEKGFEDLDEEDDWDYEYDLLAAAKVIIADDTNAYQLFGDAVFSCPQEDFLEGAALPQLSIRQLTSPRLLSGARIATPQFVDQGRVQANNRDQAFEEGSGDQDTGIGATSTILARAHAHPDACAVFVVEPRTELRRPHLRQAHGRKVSCV